MEAEPVVGRWRQDRPRRVERLRLQRHMVLQLHQSAAFFPERRPSLGEYRCEQPHRQQVFILPFRQHSGRFHQHFVLGKQTEIVLCRHLPAPRQALHIGEEDRKDHRKRGCRGWNKAEVRL